VTTLYCFENMIYHHKKSKTAIWLFDTEEEAKIKRQSCIDTFTDLGYDKPESMVCAVFPVRTGEFLDTKWIDNK